MSPPPGSADLRLAYKTGTSYGHRDAWAIGYDGNHVAGVWIGRADGTPVPGAFGGEIAAPVLFDIFQRLNLQIAPLGPPPPETLLPGLVRLPEPLRRFRGRDAVFAADDTAPKVAFPPDGARLDGTNGALTLKIRDGTLPVTVLANGLPVAHQARRRDIALTFDEKGASTLTVIDAEGRADRVSIWID